MTFFYLKCFSMQLNDRISDIKSLFQSIMLDEKVLYFNQYDSAFKDLYSCPLEVIKGLSDKEVSVSHRNKEASRGGLTCIQHNFFHY